MIDRTQSETTQTNGIENRSSERLHQDIRHTRADMDETLEALGERLHPRHLLDDVVGMFASGDGRVSRSDIAATSKRAGRSIARSLREHPIPALLCGAGILWWIYDEYESDGGELDLEEGEFFGKPHGGDATPEWSNMPLAWQEGYGWVEEAEETWSERARQTFDDLKTRLGDSSASAEQRVKLAAGRVMSLSGRKHKDIHRQWAALQEHSGSVVDARTGEPYDESYRQEWENLAACDSVACQEAEHGDSSTKQRAEATIQKLRDALNQSGQSAKETAQKSAAIIGEYGRQSGESFRSWSQATRDRISSAGRATSQSARSMGQRARRGGARAGRKMQDGYGVARDSVGEAVQEYPLAVAAACFGLGLIGGLALPHTRYEDDLMGEASDETKAQAQAAGRDAYERGKHVASATAAAAMEEAEHQGLTPERVGDKARDTVDKSRQAMHEAAESAKSSAAGVRKGVESVAQEATKTAKQEAKKKS